MQSTCFQLFSIEKEWFSWNSCTLLKVSSRAVAGAIRNASKSLLFNWNELISLQFLQTPWRVSKFLFVHWLVQSKCFQIIAFQLKSSELLEAFQIFYSCIGRCNPHASKSLLFIWKAMNSLVLTSKHSFATAWGSEHSLTYKLTKTYIYIQT